VDSLQAHDKQITLRLGQSFGGSNSEGSAYANAMTPLDLGRPVVRVGLWALIVVAVLGFTITLQRTPTRFPDGTLYASITRSWQLHGDGVPSMLRHSPLAVDHRPFYGPVFFSLATGSFDLFGFSMRSFRLVSLLSVLAIAMMGSVLARALSGERDRGLWAFGLLVLTPELAASATAGAMDPVAVALELAGLTAFVLGLLRGTRSAWYGLASGLFLALAALTTPRTWLFIAAFLMSGVLIGWTQHGRTRSTWTALAVAAWTVVVCVTAWATYSHTNPLSWARYIGFIITHEDTDVAILPAATRQWAMNWRYVITPAVAIAGALLATPALMTRGWTLSSESAGAVFAVVVGWITLVLTACVMNLTFSCGTYLSVPLFASVVALPRRYFRVRSLHLVVAVAGLLAFDIGARALDYIRVASTWSARDPDRIRAFIAQRVPPRSDVIGPEDLYFWPVERSGSRYFSIWPESWADWTRWVPQIEPSAVGPRPRRRSLTLRFLIWPAGEGLLPEYACAHDHVVGVFKPPPDDIALPKRLTTASDRRFPASVLYALGPQCPTSGYNPSGPSGSRASR
jgi:hypothetical protein